MILLLDIGNSNVVLGAHDGRQFMFTARLSTIAERTADEWAGALSSALGLHGASGADIEGAMISCVVPPVVRPMREAIEMLCARRALVVGPGIKTGLEILIDNPAQLGSDMVCSAVAACARGKLPALVCDLGTATKISAVNHKGQFIGCSIAPGVQTSIQALSRATAQLPHIAIEAPQRVIGTNTVDSMQSGVVFGTAAMIDGMITRMEEELGMPCQVLVTGGLSSEICRHVRHSIIPDKDLVLEGLYLLYLKNVEKTR